MVLASRCLNEVLVRTGRGGLVLVALVLRTRIRLQDVMDVPWGEVNLLGGVEPESAVLHSLVFAPQVETTGSCKVLNLLFLAMVFLRVPYPVGVITEVIQNTM
jgi:hypothetical protein